MKPLCCKSAVMTADLARSLWSYDRETGDLTWLVPAAVHIKAGTIAGSPDKRGYVVVGYAYRTYQAHRLIWLIETGEWPDGEIDHEDLNKGNNRWHNLRPATRAQNQSNVGLRKDNTSGIRGVSYKRTGRGRKRWVAHISHLGRNRQIGRYLTREEAAAAYAAEATRLKGEFARV